MSQENNSEKIARVETNVDWLVKAVAKMEPKLDRIAEASELRWGKILGVTITVSFIVSSIIGIARVLASG